MFKIFIAKKNLTIKDFTIEKKLQLSMHFLMSSQDASEGYANVADISNLHVLKDVEKVMRIYT